MAENVLTIELRDTGPPADLRRQPKPPTPVPAVSGQTTPSSPATGQPPPAESAAVRDILHGLKVADEARRAADSLELDASKLARGPQFDPDAMSKLVDRILEDRKSADSIELDASKGAKFDLGDDSPVKKNMAEDIAAGIELNLDRIIGRRDKPVGIGPLRDLERWPAKDATQRDDDSPKWLKTYDEITDKLAKRLLTVQEAQDRIDRLVAGRRDEITDWMRSQGQLGVNEDAADKLKRSAVDEVSPFSPIVGRKVRPIAAPISFEQEQQLQLARDEDAKKWRAEREQKARERAEDAERERLRQNQKFGGQVQAINTGLLATISGGPTAKVGAAVQIGASGLLGSGVAAAAAGPIGMAAIGAAGAIGALALAAAKAKENLDAFADRGRELKGFNAEIAVAAAVADVAKMQADIKEANKGGKEFAGAISASSKLDIAIREAMQPLERVGAKLLTLIAQDLTPIIEKIGQKLEKIEGMYDAIVAVKEY